MLDAIGHSEDKTLSDLELVFARAQFGREKHRKKYDFKDIHVTRFRRVSEDILRMTIYNLLGNRVFSQEMKRSTVETYINKMNEFLEGV